MGNKLHLKLHLHVYCWDITDVETRERYCCIHLHLRLGSGWAGRISPATARVWADHAACVARTLNVDDATKRAGLWRTHDTPAFERAFLVSLWVKPVYSACSKSHGQQLTALDLHPRTSCWIASQGSPFFNSGMPKCRNVWLSVVPTNRPLASLSINQYLDNASTYMYLSLVAF
jgi:hypothetical protein